MEDNEDTCQFTMNDNLITYSRYVPKPETIRKKLVDRYNDDVIVVSESNQYKQTTVCFPNAGHAILTNSWYESKNTNMHDARLWVVMAVAQIISDNDIPASLKLLLETITTQRKNEGMKHENNMKFIAHAIISATRTRSFISPILLGVGTFLYRKYGSRDLVLPALGFSSSYNDVRNFEVSNLQQPLKIVSKNSFTQFLFDNADINIYTIDSHDTFRAMGAPIDKIWSIPSATSLSVYGTIQLDVFKKLHQGELASLTVHDVTNGEREVLRMSTDLKLREVGNIKDMLPYFHASGHFNYAKASLLYLQDMLELENHPTPTKYEQYILMRAIKANGGLSQGRGISDETLAIWIVAMPTAVDISHQFAEFCGLYFTSTDQHIDSTESRRMRDNIEVHKYCDRFDSHDLFHLRDTIMSISTRVLGDENINFHEAYETGKSSMTNITVVPLRGMNCAVKINDELVPVNPDAIFRRIPFHTKSQEQLKSYFAFDLVRYPFSMKMECIRHAKPLYYGLTMLKDCFLSNDQNKMCLISIFTDKLTAQSFHVNQAIEDEDPLIVSTAIDLAEQGAAITLWQHLPTEAWKGHNNNLMYSPSICKLSEEAKKNIFFLRVFSGCYSMLAFFRQGKTKSFKTFENSSLHRTVAAFMDPDATPDQVAEAGAKLYSVGSIKSRN
ncbi:hypothetical protein PR048_009123 [Dryococelus australis]|uniref:Uncharacterized protein n=1 Tax=Dryococelus australis TaxID=614101 RepID=A0ABQ9HZ09_9NEOP|nr:hypothetical protein PR048_009123 [Dryococelus australis]